MVKAALAIALFMLAVATPLAGQASSDLERRISQLEEQMRRLAPGLAASAEKDLVRRLEALERQMEEFRAAKVPGKPEIAPLATPPAGQAAVSSVAVTGDYQTTTKETRLPVAGYMDFHFNRDSGQPWRPDFHRFVLLFGHSFSDRIKFWSELEVEHAFVEGGEPTGELALEQAYLDFLVKPYFNIRAGMMLSPVGIINERHEPPAFNGVERPFVETVIIPSTWRELGFGATGDLGRGFRYRAYLTSSLDASRFDAEAGISGGRTAGFDASFRNPAKVARLEYAGIRKLMLGTSFYSGHAGFNTPGINPRVAIAEFDGRFSAGRADFRALFADTWLSKAGELNRHVQFQAGVSPNVASRMRGYYAEPAWHIFPRRSRNDVIVFGRYEKYNTQHRMPAGYLPLAEFNRSSWITGVTYKPNPDVAVKFDYVFNRNAGSVVRPVNGINLGIGWWF